MDFSPKPARTPFFTSDTHWGHGKIAAHRGFDSSLQMNHVLIERWNAKVRPDDVVYHLGDFSFMGAEKTRDIIKSLHGKIILIPGNHDKGLNNQTKTFFHSVEPPIRNVKVPVNRTDGENDVYRMVLSHFPLLVWDRCHYGSWHLHGHSHGHLKFPNPNARIMDVGIDASPDMTPFSFEEVATYMQGRDHKPFDQHGVIDEEE
jgi:calcineurin-like phosphoesterase family protein